MADSNVRVIGRYALHNAIAAGGMATVHLGRLMGPVGFSRTVAIKRLHAQFASDPEFVSMFLDEARLAARIRHPNVVPTLDVVATGGELFLVMDYVPGESVARLMRVLRERQQPIPLRILSTIMAGALHGLHAAHEAKDERGSPLGIVHRDVSPQNVLLGTDGTPRVLDFGVAKAAGRVQTTREGQIKGKLSYMPPEQLRGATVGRTTDIYAAGVMLWELLTGQRLFAGDNEGAIVAKVLEGRVEPPSHVLMRSRRMTLTDQSMRQLEALDQTILRALQMNPDARFQTAREMAVEIERKMPPATASECSDWLESVASEVLNTRAQMIAEIEASGSHDMGEDHIMSVLNAKATLGPSSARIPQAASSSRQSFAQMQQTAAMPQTHSHSLTPRSGMIQMQSGRYPTVEPPVTQPSSISVSHASMHAPAQDYNRRNAIAAAVIGLLVGGLVLVGALAYSRSRSSPVTASEPFGSASTPVPTAVPTNADPIPQPTVVQPVAPVPTTIDIDNVDAGPPQKVRPPPVTTGKVRPPPAPAPHPQPSPASNNEDCSTPYWFDAQGVKHYKTNCLSK